MSFFWPLWLNCLSIFFKGDLKQFLRDCRPNLPSQRERLTTRDLTTFVIQIADAMRFLEVSFLSMIIHHYLIFHASHPSRCCYVIIIMIIIITIFMITIILCVYVYVYLMWIFLNDARISFSCVHFSKHISSLEKARNSSRSCCTQCSCWREEYCQIGWFRYQIL